MQRLGLGLLFFGITAIHGLQKQTNTDSDSAPAPAKFEQRSLNPENNEHITERVIAAVAIGAAKQIVPAIEKNLEELIVHRVQDILHNNSSAAHGQLAAQGQDQRQPPAAQKRKGAAQDISEEQKAQARAKILKRQQEKAADVSEEVHARARERGLKHKKEKNGITTTTTTTDPESAAADVSEEAKARARERALKRKLEKEANMTTTTTTTTTMTTTTTTTTVAIAPASAPMPMWMKITGSLVAVILVIVAGLLIAGHCL